MRPTAEGLVAIVRGAVLIEPGCPEAPTREFVGHLDAFVAAVVPQLSTLPNVRSRRRSPSD